MASTKDLASLASPPKTSQPGWLARLMLALPSSGFGLVLRPPQNLNFKIKFSNVRRKECLNHNYMTSARFSSSCCSTGIEQPAISTRPAASNAACGETPYPRPIRNTCSSSAASRESASPPCNRSFRRAASSVVENLSLSLMVVITSDLISPTYLDSAVPTFVACNLVAAKPPHQPIRGNLLHSSFNPLFCVKLHLKRLRSQGDFGMPFEATKLTNCVVLEHPLSKSTQSH